MITLKRTQILKKNQRIHHHNLLKFLKLKDTNETSETAIDEDASTKEQNNKDNDTAQDDDNIKEDSNTQEESTNTSSQSSEVPQTKKTQMKHQKQQ